MSADASPVGQYFDRMGTEEWERLEATVEGRVKYAIHRRFLAEYIAAGSRVADVGCGPGRFSIDAIGLGARVTLVDVSDAQLAGARARIAAARCEAGVEAAIRADACSLPMLGSASFDAVICYGALSYARERHTDMLDELLRICRPGGVLLLSATSLWGTFMLAGTLDADGFLLEIERHIPWTGGPLPDVVLTAPGSDEFHLPMALFSSTGLARLLADRACEVERLAAANPISRPGLPLERVSASPAAEARLLQLEMELCERPGAVDSGTHLLAVARRQ